MEDPNELMLEKVDGEIIKKTISVTQSSTGQWATNIAKLPDKTTVSVRAYLTYTNRYGDSFTIYSDMVLGTVQAETQK